ncbi:hypothetical protein KM043_015381 [Ampulex compressa]|nr:hypothetical protein KM043_015381 [Ampulex compressa]
MVLMSRRSDTRVSRSTRGAKESRCSGDDGSRSQNGEKGIKIPESCYRGENAFTGAGSHNLSFGYDQYPVAGHKSELQARRERRTACSDPSPAPRSFLISEQTGLASANWHDFTSALAPPSAPMPWNGCPY